MLMQIDSSVTTVQHLSDLHPYIKTVEHAFLKHEFAAVIQRGAMIEEILDRYLKDNLGEDNPAYADRWKKAYAHVKENILHRLPDNSSQMSGHTATKPEAMRALMYINVLLKYAESLIEMETAGD